jgi:hypothetical protein
MPPSRSVLADERPPQPGKVVPRRAGTALQKRHECLQGRVDPGKEREIVG